MTLVEENKDTLKNYEELWSKILDPIRTITNTSDDYDKKTFKSSLLRMIIYLERKHLNFVTW